MLKLHDWPQQQDGLSTLSDRQISAASWHLQAAQHHQHSEPAVADAHSSDINKQMEDDALRLEAAAHDQNGYKTPPGPVELFEERKSAPARLDEKALDKKPGLNAAAVRIRMFWQQMGRTIGCRACMSPGPGAPTASYANKFKQNGKRVDLRPQQQSSRMQVRLHRRMSEAAQPLLPQLPHPPRA